MNLQVCEEVSLASASGGGGEKQGAQVVQSKPDERSMPRPSFLTEDVVRGVRNVSDLGVPAGGEGGALSVFEGTCAGLQIKAHFMQNRLETTVPLVSLTVVVTESNRKLTRGRGTYRGR